MALYKQKDTKKYGKYGEPANRFILNENGLFEYGKTTVIAGLVRERLGDVL